MSIPENVRLVKREDNLALYSYTDDAQHPTPASFWKGVIVDEATGEIVARSYQHSPTVVVDDVSTLPPQMFTRFYEGTVIRFYMHNDEPMISTHSQIDIKDKKSRITGGKTFVELINEAIANWPYYERRSGKSLSFSTKTWRDLCQPGIVNVFLLIDNSNQITDLTDLSQVYEIPTADGGMEVITEAPPLLLHALTLRQTPDGLLPTNEIISAGPGRYPMLVNGEYVEEEFEDISIHYPRVPLLDAEEAQQQITLGRAVIGYDPSMPDVTVKYLSPEYARKLEIAGETFNPIHRFHELMDVDPALTYEYVANLPWHHKNISYAELSQKHLEYLEVTTNYLTNVVMERVQSKRADLPKKIYELTLAQGVRTADLVSSLVRKYNKKFSRNMPKGQLRRLERDIAADIALEIQSLPYTKQHTLHGLIVKAIRGFLE